MQFGTFAVGEAGRIRATVTIAKKAEEVGADVFATGEHHNPSLVSRQ
jgi:alkanesulfonate monooxygenase SsuD/methylene tetrahydromethanopterin reductase-like flavin-dependent oxidoreductase (luciferase family)